MLGYRHYADDVLEYFVQKSVANGIDIIRIFDALNDIKNLQTAIKAAKKEKAHAQVAISYTTGPVFTTEYFVDYAKRIEETGADSICIKDMAALLTPYTTAELVTALKEAVSIPIQLPSCFVESTPCIYTMLQIYIYIIWSKKSIPFLFFLLPQSFLKTLQGIEGHKLLGTVFDVHFLSSQILSLIPAGCGFLLSGSHGVSSIRHSYALQSDRFVLLSLHSLPNSFPLK